jgi:2'-5' RNA ligase
MTRAFIAFKLPADVVDSLRVLQSGLKKRGLNLRWVHPENIHLTLKFLGDVPTEELQEVKHVIGEVARHQVVFSLEAKGLGVFPTVKKARVLWSGIHGDVIRLNSLQGTLDQSLAALGFEPEKRSFRGHLTLGRFKGRVDGKRLAAMISEFGSYASPPFASERLILFQSDLKPSGAVYTELAGEDLSIDRNSIHGKTD